MSKKAGRASRKGGLRRSKKAGLRRTKKAGLSRRVKRGGRLRMCEEGKCHNFGPSSGNAQWQGKPVSVSFPKHISFNQY